MLIILGWITAFVLLIYGICNLSFTLTDAGISFFDKKNEELIKAEVEMMKKDGKFEGEPEHMKDFRVIRSELDLVNAQNSRSLTWKDLLISSIPLIAGIVLIVFLVIKVWH